MSRRLPLTIVATLALVALAAPAPAGAADVGRQVERAAPSKYPESIPGCRPRCRRGRTISRRHVLLSRTVRLEPGERRTTVRFRCPRGRRFQTFGFLTGGSADVGLNIPDSQLPYTRRSRVRVIGDRGLQPLSRPSTGTLYAICVRR